MHLLVGGLASAERKAARASKAATAGELSPGGCGYSVECARSYSLSEINASASEWRHEDILLERALRSRHAIAREACLLAASQGGGGVRRLEAAIGGISGSSSSSSSNNATPDLRGGWCYGPHAQFYVRPEKQRPPENVTLPNGMSYMLPYGHVRADEGFTEALAKLIGQNHPKADGGQAVTTTAGRRHHSPCLNDFGAGVGQYGRALLSQLGAGLCYRGYDGGGDVEAFTGGFVQYFDLTMPLALPRAEWVMSLEVGEHIPSAHEATVIRNLHAHACRGIILSWATLNQSGIGHVNNHAPDYLATIFEGLGYWRNTAYEQALRKAPRTNVVAPWLRRNTVVWERHRRISPC